MRLAICLSIFCSSYFLWEWALTPHPLVAGAGVPEICDNAIDDDLDGLIDFNDADCDCPLAKPVSLIPNPSFEDQHCCPPTYSRLDCADTWIQASRATTDYIHDCGFTGWENMPVPRPIPDGKACIGFRDGRPGRNQEDPNPNWKEYAGACLTSPLRAHQRYRFEFYIGFVNPTNSPPTTVTFFGTSDCEFLPFGENKEDFGCPTNDPNWYKLGAVHVSSYGGWIKTKIDIVPDQDIKAIAIGPSCLERPMDVSLYYFFDNLVLAEQEAFEFQITHRGGHPCQSDFTLGVPAADTLDYQWYQDGVALVGETSPLLSGALPEARYQTLLTGPNSCKMTTSFFHQPPTVRHTLEKVMCENDSYRFSGYDLLGPGTYFDTLKSIHQCDSIVRLELVLESHQPEIREVKISAAESYDVGPYRFQQEGEYQVNLKSYYGCDSTILLLLSHFDYYIPNAFSPNGDDYNDLFFVFGNDDIQLVSQFSVFDRWGKLVYRESDLLPNQTDRSWDGTARGRLLPNGVYIYLASIIFSDGKERQFSGNVTLIR